jgi:hypothetical protein
MNIKEFYKWRSKISTKRCTPTCEALRCQLHRYAIHHDLPFGGFATRSPSSSSPRASI